MNPLYIRGEKRRGGKHYLNRKGIRCNKQQTQSFPFSNSHRNVFYWIILLPSQHLYLFKKLQVSHNFHSIFIVLPISPQTDIKYIWNPAECRVFCVQKRETRTQFACHTIWNVTETFRRPDSPVMRRHYLLKYIFISTTGVLLCVCVSV